MRLLGAVVLWMLMGCSVPNPRSCLDGSCTDPLFPYCDVEGFVAEEPQTCITVDCTADTFLGCRDGRAITCNSTGNNYDLVECPRGCNENGCIPPPADPDCTTNQQCTNPTPICSAENVCRGCSLDEECESKVCDVQTGACAALSEVVYTSAFGVDAAPCTMADPCSLPRAITVATSNTLRSWVRLAPGNYDKQAQSSSGVVMLVGPKTAIVRGETSAPNEGTISVGAGGKMSIRGITIDLTRQGAFCGGVGTGAFLDGGELHLRDVLITTSMNSIRFANGCVASLVESKFQGNGSVSIASTVGRPGAHVTVDRFHMQATGAGTSATFHAELSTITNSVFEFVTVELNSSKFAFNSVYGLGFGMSAIGGRVENSIIYIPYSTDALTCDGCNPRSNIAFPQMTAIPSVTVADPLLVDVVGHDFRPQATSPAVDTAMPQSDLTSDHDFAGAPRPQGAALDIGAYERAP